MFGIVKKMSLAARFLSACSPWRVILRPDRVWATGKRRGFKSFKSESLGILVVG